MKIWFDISQISYWNGGVVGIVRAELEIAYNFSKISEDISFCRIDSTKNKIEEVTRDELSWLLNSSTPVEGFLKYKDSKKSTSCNKNLYETIETFYASKSKLQHIFMCGRFTATLLPKILGERLYRLCDILESKLNSLKKKEEYQDNKHENFSHPFQRGDIIFSAGWVDSGKEKLYKKAKRALDGRLHLTYLIYDTIPINPKTKFLYSKDVEARFYDYFTWVSNNCDLIFYGGKTAMQDSQNIQLENQLPIPKGIPIRFGDIPNSNLHSLSDIQIDNFLSKLGLTKNNYLLCVGSIEPRKNHNILYKAYRELIDFPNKYNFDLDYLPKLVIAGKLYGHNELVYSFIHDPKIKDKIIFISPTDEELDALYKNCLFTLMPTMYEGWNLTMPESLSYGKFCISSNVPPMVEVGKELVEYADPDNPIEWAEILSKYCQNPILLKDREEYIKTHWKNYSWFECALSIFDALKTEKFVVNHRKTLWFDLTLTNNLYRKIDGIPRVELSLAWELFNNKQNLIDICFFEFKSNVDGGSFVELDAQDLPWLRKRKDEYVDFYHNHQEYKRNLYNTSNVSNVDIRNNLITLEPSIKRRIKISILHLLGIFPLSFLNKLYFFYVNIFRRNKKEAVFNTIDSSYGIDIENIHEMMFEDYPFKKNDIIVSVGLDWESKYLKGISFLKNKISLTSIYLIHDMIPLVEPNFYQENIFELYKKFFYWVCESSDMIFFGSQTALEDAKKISINIKFPEMLFLRLGSNFIPNHNLITSNEDGILRDMGITKPFILSVGTIQIRKNHEVIYKAFLKWINETMEDEVDNLPQIIFAGHKGWLTEQLINQIQNDDRVKNRLLIVSPSDEELDILYRKCLFTVLPSLYEGAALPISESLSYGKFCLASDILSLRESGQTFVEYIPPRDIVKWKDAMKYYSCNHLALEEKEKYIKENKSFISWSECAEDLLDKVLTNINGMNKQ
ncbi:glycosyl transferase [Gallibacterium salpingitidis]|uniref:Glycosyl transferase n=1 Tax=Gallibacterium salpingitidis TaxID=505341 RepID=A0AB36E0C0_9PAST|nr:glycosyltransferase [Gallibacterium salpingitidis]OBX08054.1 glycosyl transferase [Gallibacterium salpingitidis]